MGGSPVHNSDCRFQNSNLKVESRSKSRIKSRKRIKIKIRSRI